MINLGRHQDLTWPDQWTSVTEDGKRSAQFEHTFLVTETGCDILTARVGARHIDAKHQAHRRDNCHFITPIANFASLWKGPAQDELARRSNGALSLVER